MSFNHADSVIHGVSLDTVAGLGSVVVDRVGRACSTSSSNVKVSSDTDTRQFIEIEDFVSVASGAADSQLVVKEVRSSAVGAFSIDQVEIFNTDTNSTNKFFID